MEFRMYSGLLTVGALAFVTLTTGCATKKYVRNQVSPIDQRVNQVNQTANQNKEAIAKLGEKEETDVSRVDERAMTAQNAAKDASNAAQQADQRASQAQTMARNAGDRVNQLDQRFQNTVQNIDNYQLVSTEKVLFPLNKATLTKSAKEKLDTALQNMGNTQHYLIEVEGFTDSTGSKTYNLGLSQRRADAVVRYLMVQHQVPLYRIHVVGLGEDQPVASNHKRTGREENRRVEVRTFAANWNGQPGQQGQTQQQGMSQQQGTQQENPGYGTSQQSTSQTTTDQTQAAPGQMQTPGTMQTAPGQVPVQSQTQPGQMTQPGQLSQPGETMQQPGTQTVNPGTTAPGTTTNPGPVTTPGTPSTPPETMTQPGQTAPSTQVPPAEQNTNNPGETTTTPGNTNPNDQNTTQPAAPNQNQPPNP